MGRSQGSDAVRILDFPHAGEHLAQIGQAVFGEGTAATDTWFTQQLHQLKQDGPAAVLAEVRRLAEAHADCPAVLEPLAYLEKREAHMQYPTFQAAGWPIGDGAVESGNKLVVEARLKGSGMHWARPHVDPMLALRNWACNDRWDEGWNLIVGELRRQTRQHSHEQRQKRRAPCEANIVLLRPTDPPPTAAQSSSTKPVSPSARQSTSAIKPKSGQPKEAHRPAANHPWRTQPAVLKTKRQQIQSPRS